MSEKPSRRAVLGGAAAAGLAALAAPAAASAAPAGRGRGRFAGKVVAITGATSGIGRETALAFAAEGAKVGFCGRREDLGRQVEREIRRAGGEASYVRADVRVPAQVKAFVDGVAGRYGRLDVAFANAGIHLGKPLHDTTVEEWDDVHLTNTRGVFLTIKYAAPHLREGGVVVCTASAQAGHTRPGHAAYSASKRAVQGIVRSAALDYGPKGIRVLAVDPGTTDTRLVRPDGIPDEAWAQFKLAWGPLNVHGLPRMAEAKEIATAVVSLSTPDFSYLTGTEILVDGGMSAGRPMTFPPGFELPG
ncbi:SDR family NAD(P)-dependent oxidoreductase [Actinophytocola algeriensis]|uniref:NAD(P)-dependent dehydrogenase (Short-subunit alcohol dehydrogenase family) n=1 Tax=Actinophytocola algeriensis TaxID=1768010 RepID=A0A7W7VCB8_9PSEU|nr:SDR family oxidoreductase [Actinophytocola algeriensis]MBB4904934.1 NAD(P)-dependent dehydrogenase (short-subunit alcohol dehydrogenase family) [Actinophytocola algeriensis]MBE1476206.1 NAD(P)-dependent dehydrogenase (short-subunit alcohol dehydrogenase family) [Actinophytocola algeriensis]